MKNNEKPKYLTEQEVQEIVDNSNIIDYFHYLADISVLRFDKKTGKEYLFSDLSGAQKISVSNKGWRDFKSGKGGGIIKAIEEFQNLTWLEAVHWLNEFNKDSGKYVELRGKLESDFPTASDQERRVTMVITPNNPNLFRYFGSRGISRETLIKYTKQIHFIHGNKKIYGIGWKNLAGGYEVKNEGIKSSKIGTSDITVFNAEKEKTLIFEGICDLLSMIEILQNKAKNPDDYCLVCLNSVSNTNHFIKWVKEKNKKIYLCLDGDQAGQEATENIIQAIPGSSDVRANFNISLQGYKDLNDYWKGLMLGKKK